MAARALRPDARRVKTSPFSIRQRTRNPEGVQDDISEREDLFDEPLLKQVIAQEERRTAQHHQKFIKRPERVARTMSER